MGVTHKSHNYTFQKNAVLNCIAILLILIAAVIIMATHSGVHGSGMLGSPGNSIQHEIARSGCQNVVRMISPA